MNFSLMHFMCVFVFPKIVEVNIKGEGKEGQEKAEERGGGRAERRRRYWKSL